MIWSHSAIAAFIPVEPIGGCSMRLIMDGVRQLGGGALNRKTGPSTAATGVGPVWSDGSVAQRCHAGKPNRHRAERCVTSTKTPVAANSSRLPWRSRLRVQPSGPAWWPTAAEPLPECRSAAAGARSCGGRPPTDGLPARLARGRAECGGDRSPRRSAGSVLCKLEANRFPQRQDRTGAWVHSDAAGASGPYLTC